MARTTMTRKKRSISDCKILAFYKGRIYEYANPQACAFDFSIKVAYLRELIEKGTSYEGFTFDYAM